MHYQKMSREDEQMLELEILRKRVEQLEHLVKEILRRMQLDNIYRFKK